MDRASTENGRELGAVEHSILIAYWHMFTNGELYNDLGGDYFQRCDPARATKRLVAKLEALGHRVTFRPWRPERISPQAGLPRPSSAICGLAPAWPREEGVGQPAGTGARVSSPREAYVRGRRARLTGDEARVFHRRDTGETKRVHETPVCRTGRRASGKPRIPYRNGSDCPRDGPRARQRGCQVSPSSSPRASRPRSRASSSRARWARS